VECAAGIQWILQRRAGERHGVPRWDDRSYCRTKEALIRCCRASAGETDPAAWVTLAALPERVRPRGDGGEVLAPFPDQDTIDKVDNASRAADLGADNGRVP
jgi:hypothetical protein